MAGLPESAGCAALNQASRRRGPSGRSSGQVYAEAEEARAEGQAAGERGLSCGRGERDPTAILETVVDEGP